MKTKIFVTAILFGLIAFSCKDNEVVQVMPNYFYSIPQTNLKTKAIVGCYYQIPLSTMWDVTQVDTPTVSGTFNGQYDPIYDIGVMKAHTDTAAAYGIDYFIFDWNETSLTRSSGTSAQLINVFAAQPKVKADSLKMITRWNYMHLGAKNTLQLQRKGNPNYNATVLSQFIDDVNFLDTAYLRKPYNYKIDSVAPNGSIVKRPVVMFAVLVGNLYIDWAFAVDTMRQQIRKNSGVNPYIIIEYTTSFSPPERYKSIFMMGDAVSMQNMKANTYDRSVGYWSFIDLNWQLWNSSLTSWGKDFVPTVWPAYSRKYETNPSAWWDIPRTPENYINYCNVAKRNMSSKQLVLVYSWNDFKLGAALEPCKGFGSKYLQLTKDQFSAK